MIKTNLKPLLAATAVALGTCSAAVLAAPLTELGFQQGAGWVDPTTDGTGDTGFFGSQTFSMIGGTLAQPRYPANVYQGMTWQSPLGTPSYPNSSKIELFSFTDTDSPSAGSALNGDSDANSQWNAGEVWIIDRLLQTNNIISGLFPNPLWIADTLANLRFYSDADARTNEIYLDPNSPTRISFWETFNEPASPNNPGACTSPNPLNTQCDDIYTVLSAELDDLVFPYDGYLYTINFALIPGPGVLVCLGGEDCDGIVPDGTIRVFTPENNPGTSEIFVGMAWTAQRIPEPATLAVLGLGLAGMGFSLRRRRDRS